MNAALAPYVPVFDIPDTRHGTACAQIAAGLAPLPAPWRNTRSGSSRESTLVLVTAGNTHAGYLRSVDRLGLTLVDVVSSSWATAESAEQGCDRTPGLVSSAVNRIGRENGVRVRRRGPPGAGRHHCISLEQDDHPIGCHRELFESCGFMIAHMLLMGDRMSESGTALTTGFDSLYGNGRFRARVFDAAGMDDPWAMSESHFYVNAGTGGLLGTTKMRRGTISRARSSSRVARLANSSPSE